MTKERTTHALLVVVAVLLALNLAAQLPWPTAQAQQPEMAMQPPPRLLGMATKGDMVLRLWSDGIVERRTIVTSYRWWVDPERTEVPDSQP